MSFDHRIILLGNWDLNERHELQTVALETVGLKVYSLLVIDGQGTFGYTKDDKREATEEFKNELFDDMYDDDLYVKVKEAYDGKDVIDKLSGFILDRWDEDLQVYSYNLTDEAYERLIDTVSKENIRAYITKYSDSVYNGNNEKETMEKLGIKTGTMLQGSMVSHAYFLIALAEMLFDR